MASEGRPSSGNLPYPKPTSLAATKVMRANRRCDTKPEVRIRSALHGLGYRFRKDRTIDVAGLRVKGDIVLVREKVAVFVDGCFWHLCSKHRRVPKANRDYWVPKLEGNVRRDRLVGRELRKAGWKVVRIWEHSAVDAAVLRVVRAVSGG